MIKTETANKILTQWTNGNRSDIKKLMKNKNKCFALDMVSYMREQGYKTHNALYEVYKMCE